MPPSYAQAPREGAKSNKPTKDRIKVGHSRTLPRPLVPFSPPHVLGMSLPQGTHRAGRREARRREKTLPLLVFDTNPHAKLSARQLRDRRQQSRRVPAASEMCVHRQLIHLGRNPLCGLGGAVPSHRLPSLLRPGHRKTNDGIAVQGDQEG